MNRDFGPGLPIRISDASVAEIADLHRLETAGMVDAWNLQMLADEVGREGSTVLVARTGDDAPVIAYLASRRTGEEAEILRLVVDSAHRNHGVGAQLLAKALESLAGAGASDCYLEVREDNRPALELYRRFSFQVLQQRLAYYPDGGTALVLHARLGGQGSDVPA